MKMNFESLKKLHQEKWGKFKTYLSVALISLASLVATQSEAQNGKSVRNLQ